ncbi:MAG TPA: malate/lactate/ureidoglycolate dehydrogenase [Noviherbaspirillum sp.]
MSEAASSVTVHAEPLKAVVRAIVARTGSDEREAALVADHLVEANLTGHDSHGVGMLPRYIEVFRAGDLKINQHVSVIGDTGPMLTLDGNAGFGQVMGVEAMALGIARAAQFGVAVVGLANSHHIGRIGHWAEQCIAAGYISMHYVNVVTSPLVAPFGGRDARIGTNPFCVGVPLPGKEPILLDFATSRVAMGKVRVACNKGEQVKPDTLLDHRGDPTTDPATMFAEPRGALLPLGEHKGYGLAMICEILGGALSGGMTLHAKPSTRAVINNMLSIIIDPHRLGTAANLASQTEAFVAWVKASPVAQDVDRIRTPGEPEQESRRRRSASGIPIDATTWQQIVDAAQQVGMGRAEVERLAK